MPGAVAGMAYALEKYGTLKWAEVAQPAYELAQNGFPVGRALEALYERFADQVEFFIVYIKEAHPEDGWVVTMNP